MCRKWEEHLSHTSEQKDPISRISEQKEPISRISKQKERISHTSKRKDSVSHSPERRESRSSISKQKESLSHTSEWKESVSHTSKRKESRSPVSKRKESLSHTSERKESASHTSDRKESRSPVSKRKESLSRTSERKESASHTSDRKEPRSPVSKRKESLSHTSERKESASHTSDRKESRFPVSKRKEPLSHTSEQKKAVSHNSEHKESASHTSEQKESHSPIPKQKETLSHTSDQKESISHTFEWNETVSPISERQESLCSSSEQKESILRISERERKESLSPISEEEFEEYDDECIADAQPTNSPVHNHFCPNDAVKGEKRKVGDPGEASSMSNSLIGARRDPITTSPIETSSAVKEEPGSIPLESDKQEPQANGMLHGPPLSHHATPMHKEDGSEVREGDSLESVTTGTSPPDTANTSGTAVQRFKRKTHMSGSSLSLSSLLGDSSVNEPPSAKSEAKVEVKVDGPEKVPLPPSKPKKPCQWSTFMHPNWMEKDSELPFKTTQYMDPTGAKKKKKKKKKTSEIDQQVDSVLEQYQEDSAKSSVTVVSSKGPRQSTIEGSKPHQWKYGGTLHSVDGKQKAAAEKGEKLSTSPRKIIEKLNGHDPPASHSDSDSSRHKGRTQKRASSAEHGSSSGRDAPPYKRTPEKRMAIKSHSPRHHYSSEDSRHSRNGRDQSRSRSPRHGNGRRASPPSHQYRPKKDRLRKRRYSRSPARAREKSLDLSSSYHSASSDDESPRSKRYRSTSDLEQQSSIEPLSSIKWSSSDTYTRDEPPSSSIFDSDDPMRIVDRWFDSSSTSGTALGSSLPQTSLWISSPQVVTEDGFDSGQYSRSVTPPQAAELRHLVPIQPYTGQ